MVSWSHLKPPDLVCSCLMSTERDFRILSQSKHVFPVPHVDVCECRTRDDCMNARLLNLVPYIAFNTTILWLRESLLSALRFSGLLAPVSRVAGGHAFSLHYFEE